LRTFVGKLLEQHLRQLFDLGRELPLDDHDALAKRKMLDLTFLFVKEANKARQRHLPEAALEFVDRALALWSSDGQPEFDNIARS